MEIRLKLPVLALLLVLLHYALAGRPRHQSINCGACLAMIDETYREIKLMDPNEKIKVDSFRVDPTGKQKSKEIPVTQSESRLSDILDTVCMKMDYYGITDLADNRHCIVRFRAMEGYAPPPMVYVIEEMKPKLKSACEDIVEDHEEELIPAFQVGLDDMHGTICTDLLGYCTAQNVTEFKDLVYAPLDFGDNADDDDDDAKYQYDDEL